MHIYPALAASHAAHGHPSATVAAVIVALVVAAVIVALLKLIARVLSPRKPKSGTTYAAAARRR